jgi:hypothetical protein
LEAKRERGRDRREEGKSKSKESGKKKSLAIYLKDFSV